MLCSPGRQGLPYIKDRGSRKRFQPKREFLKKAVLVPHEDVIRYTAKVLSLKNYS